MFVPSWTGIFFIFIFSRVFLPICSGAHFSFLQGSEADAVERLRQVDSSKSSGLKNSVLGKEDRDAPATDFSLVRQLIYILILYVESSLCVDCWTG